MGPRNQGIPLWQVTFDGRVLMRLCWWGGDLKGSVFWRCLPALGGRWWSKFWRLLQDARWILQVSDMWLYIVHFQNSNSQKRVVDRKGYSLQQHEGISAPDWQMLVVDSQLYPNPPPSPGRCPCSHHWVTQPWPLSGVMAGGGLFKQRKWPSPGTAYADFCRSQLPNMGNLSSSDSSAPAIWGMYVFLGAWNMSKKSSVQACPGMFLWLYGGSRRFFPLIRSNLSLWNLQLERVESRLEHDLQCSLFLCRPICTMSLGWHPSAHTCELPWNHRHLRDLRREGVSATFGWAHTSWCREGLERSVRALSLGMMEAEPV